MKDCANEEIFASSSLAESGNNISETKPQTLDSQVFRSVSLYEELSRSAEEEEYEDERLSCKSSSTSELIKVPACRDAQSEKGMENSNSKIVVGYALTSKKTKSFLKPKLLSLARSKGIIFVPIDRNQPLYEQGPFDIILHKISGREWFSQLEDLMRKNPDIVVLDPPEAIQNLRNRQSMLQEVAKLKLRNYGGLIYFCHTFRAQLHAATGVLARALKAKSLSWYMTRQVDIPRQLVVTGDPASIPSIVSKAGLKLPLVVKPLVVDDTARSHELSLAYDQLCLTELNPPLVLQEFVNHGGVLFKVYIVGDYIRVVRRASLPDVNEMKNGVMSFPRVSSAAASANNANIDPEVAELPPWELLYSLSKELRKRLGLRLFNLDIIRERGAVNHFYVIDINYFPGFGKMPDCEYVFTEFLLKLGHTIFERPTNNCLEDCTLDATQEIGHTKSERPTKNYLEDCTQDATQES